VIADGVIDNASVALRAGQKEYGTRLATAMSGSVQELSMMTRAIKVMEWLHRDRASRLELGDSV
jgi:hypothetical protein